jgi:hypothetical protein
MTMKLITFKAQAADHERWKKALKASGQKLSAVVRNALDDLADSVEKDGQKNG